MVNIKKILISPIVIRVLTVGLNFVSNVIINRSLGLELKGQYTTILNYANFLQLFLNLGICYAYPMLKKEKESNDAKNTILTIIWIQTIICAIIGGCALVIVASLEFTMVIILSVVMICNSQLIFIALIDDIKSRNFLLLGSTIFFIILSGLAIIFFRGKLYVVVGLMIAKYLFEIVLLCLKYNYLHFKLEKINWQVLKFIFSIGIPTAVLAILISCNYNLDILMLNWMGSGNKEIGIYGVAYSLTNMLWVLPDAFKEMIYNKTAKENNYKFVLKCIAINMLFCLIICIGFMLLGKWFLTLVYGEQYEVAYGVTLILFVGIIPMISFKLIHPIYVNNGHSKTVVGLLMIAVIVNIISSYLLIPKHGAIGASIASVISYCVCGGIFFAKFYFDYCRVTTVESNLTKEN